MNMNNWKKKTGLKTVSRYAQSRLYTQTHLRVNNAFLWLKGDILEELAILPKILA